MPECARELRRQLLLPTLLIALATLSGCGGDALELVGTVERKTLELAAPISEVIVDIPAQVGDRVEGGQVLVALDTEVADADLLAYEAAHAAATATLAEAEQEFGRIADLRRARVSTAAALDAARRGRDEAAALVAEKAARIAQAKKRLRDLTIRTHADGLVDQLPYEVGERAPAGGVVAVVLAETQPWVRVWLPSRLVAQVGRGVRSTVEVEGYGKPFEGRVEHVAAEAEFTPHYALTEKESAHLVYETRINLTDAPADLRPGLSARVQVHLDSADVSKGEGEG